MAALIVGSCAIPASATLTTYTSLSAFEAAEPGLTGDTFSNITFAQGDLGASTTAGSIVFSTNSTQLTGLTDVSGWSDGTAIDDTYSYGNSYYSITLSSLPTGLNEIAFYLDDQDPGSTFGVSVSDSEQTIKPTFTQSGDTPQFFAVVTTDPTFAAISVSNDTTASGGLLTLGDMTIGEADTPSAPEGATMLLVGTGLLVMGYWRRKAARRRRAGRILRPATA